VPDSSRERRQTQPQLSLSRPICLPFYQKYLTHESKELVRILKIAIQGPADIANITSFYNNYKY
jgi:hypothetical protein